MHTNSPDCPKYNLCCGATRIFENKTYYVLILFHNSWPGLVTQDPGGGQYVLKDYYGEAILYHVEFLGEVHSRSWVSSKAVDLYGKGKHPSHDNNNKATSKVG